MRVIRVSEEVWEAIAAKGKFGETEDDVLRRVFGIDAARQPGMITPPSQGSSQLFPSTHQSNTGRRGRGALRYANKRMSARVERGALIIQFEDSPRREWALPENKSDKKQIRSVRDQALRFAIESGASQPGQTNAVRKALTEAGYYLTK